MAKQAQNRCLDFLISPSYKVANRLSVLSFENEAGRIGHTRYYLEALEINDCNVITNGRKLFDQIVKNDI